MGLGLGMEVVMGGHTYMGHEESFWEMGGVGIPQGPGSSLGSSEKVYQGDTRLAWESGMSDPSSHRTAELGRGCGTWPHQISIPVL